MADERFKAGLDDDLLRDLHIDRIYDTLIDEDELRICDDVTKQIADTLPPSRTRRANSFARWGRT